MKKIIFLVSELAYGGTQKTIIKLVKRFVKDGYFITILTFECNLENVCTNFCINKYYAANNRRDSRYCIR